MALRAPRGGTIMALRAAHGWTIMALRPPRGRTIMALRAAQGWDQHGPHKVPDTHRRDGLLSNSGPPHKPLVVVAHPL